MYCVVDWYEGLEIVGYNLLTKRAANKLAKDWTEDTDGECELTIFYQPHSFENERACAKAVKLDELGEAD